MKHRTARLGTFLFAAFAVTACSDQVTQPALTPISGARLSVEAGSLEETLDRGALDLAALGEVADLMPSTALFERAINPNDYVCSNVSPVSTWLNASIDRSLLLEPNRFLTAYNFLAADIPTYEALFFQSASTPQYFGIDGQHTKTIIKAERDLKAFWDIESSNIQVVAMHGNVLVDTLRTKATYQLFGYSATQSAGFARTLRNAIVGSQTMVNGNHPFFTFNAVASVGPFGDKIVIGDGILQAYDALGYSDVAPTAIFAHEFAHHIQFDNGYATTGNAAERTRFGELSADFLAAYYLTHARGATLNQKRVEEFLEIFYGIGDCSFTSGGHHGTPNQRLAAARFGFELADAAHKQGHIMTADDVQAAFLAKYPTIIAPDAP
jgi:hypothetical protein